MVKFISKKEVQGQASLEYLLIFAAFFIILLMVLEIVIFSFNNLESVSDALLLRKIANIVEEEDEKFAFLSNGSKKEFEFIPSDKLNIELNNNFLILNSKEKEIKIELKNTQESFNKEFNKKFTLIILKENNKAIFLFN
jgi:uncharacterized protein (UPF0333 family)